ncbi:mRNA turnover protein 4 homolog isoform X1 [Limulus polyphemus]|uniref:Ribosome assembly factor mrt4 n=2 Tax=Limulus polyphemus TaxID=6850 RepID=A0ABM1B9C6_LIMPO|nr:mRNA turnover protein 4 homolog isoform X1 [Limulus polyphemus]
MPKSKRNKQISLTNTRKKGLELKQHLIEEIQKCVDSYAHVFVFSVQNMRNSKLKDVRQEWKHSRFFFGKNKVMTLALGHKPEDEHRDNLHLISKHLRGQCGLLFTNKNREEVLSWFSDYKDSDYARAGNVATDTVVLDEGPLTQFPHSLEQHLRQLGMPTSLQKGVVTLIKDYQICKEGEILTPEQARLLKLLEIQMADFKISVECMWSNDGSFEDFIKREQPLEGMKEQKKRKHKQQSTKKETKQKKMKSSKQISQGSTDDENERMESGDDEC